MTTTRPSLDAASNAADAADAFVVLVEALETSTNGFEESVIHQALEIRARSTIAQLEEYLETRGC